ncbi:MAG: PPC domain-containing protein [Planctomycetes bacterium]|nr:PPC domain-containing protein [Planctomycetota bacterium]
MDFRCSWFAAAARLSLVTLLAFGVTAVASAQLPVAELKSIFPPGGRQGTTADVQITGTDLDGAETLLFSHPGITAAVKMEEAGPLVKTPRPVENQFAVTIAGDVPAGIYEARAVGRFGASNPRAFVVGSLEELRDNGNNRAPENAQEIPVGSVVNGTTEGDNVDYYKLNLKQGQRVIVDCWARRIDSRMDATLVLYNEAGQELARDRDTEGRDALLDFTAPADGAYLVGVYDFLYRGGAEYFYRLRAHTGPHVDFVFPPVAEAGKAAKITVYGRNLPGSKVADDVQLDGRPLEALEVEVTPPADEKAQRQLAVTTFVKPHAASLDTFAWQFTSPAGAADPTPIAFAEAPIVVEQEPNDEPATVNKIAPPCEFVGRFYPDSDRDWVEFEAKQGDVFWVEVVSHR